MADLGLWRDAEALLRDLTSPLVVGALIGVAIAVAGYLHRRRERARDLAGLTNVRALYGDGWRPEFETTTHLFVVKGKPVTHVLHLLLSVMTVGVWLLVWLAIGMFGGERRRVVSKK